MEIEDAPIDVIGVRRGCVGAIVGVDDWDVSRMRKATEMVVYDFGSRAAAHAALPPLKLAQDIRLVNVDMHFAPSCTLILGDGTGPGTVRYPYKFRVIAPNGFTQSPMETLDVVVDIIRRGAWDEHPGERTPREAAPGAAPDEEGEAEDEARDEVRDEAPGGAPDAPERRKRPRLGASPPLRTEGAARRPRAAPMFQVEVEGFERRIRSTTYGKDRFGNRTVLGKTWVTGHDRHKTRPKRPGR